MDYRILGPLEACDDGTPLPLGGAKQRALLALLILHRGEVVSTDRLIDDLWSEDPPASAQKSVQVYISHLRKALGDGRLSTHGRGYRLDVDPGTLDLDRFEALASEGRGLLGEHDPRAAAERLREALLLWRGPALADFVFDSFAQSEIARVGELRLETLEDRIDADLALGRHAELVPELEGLTHDEPLRERLQAQLMLALYGCGRQADALEAFRRLRRRLDEDLGLEPGREIRALEQQILAQACELDGPARRIALPAPAGNGVSAGRRLVAAGLLLLAALVAVALVEITRGRSGHDASIFLRPGSIGRLDGANGRVLAAIAVPGGPARLAVSGRSVWVGSDESRTLSAIDAGMHVTVVGNAGGRPTDVAIGEGGVWVVDGAAGTVTRFSPTYGTVVHREKLPGALDTFVTDRSAAFAPWAVAVGAHGVWITDGSARLRVLDPRTGRLASTIRTREPLDGIAVGAGAGWAISGAGSGVLRIDPRIRRVTDRIAIVSRPGFQSPYPVAVEVGERSVWVLNANTQTVTRIDARARGISATIPIGIERGPLRLAVGDGAAWVANDDGTLSRIDAATNALRTFAVGQGLLDVGVAGDAVWVSAGPGPRGSPGAGAGVASAAHGPRAIDTPACSPIYYGAGQPPDVLIASDLPLQGPFRSFGAQGAAAIRLVLRQNHFRAGRYPVGYQSCDDATTNGYPGEGARCADNARAYARAPSLVGIVGPFNSGCATGELAILNGAARGAVGAVSPRTTYLGFTKRGPGSGPDEPQRFFPSGRRSFTRIIATDDFQGAADAMLAQRVGARRVFVLDDREPYGQALARVFLRVARRLALPIAGRSSWDARAHDYTRLALRIRRAGADAVFVSGVVVRNGGRLLRDLRSVLGAQVWLMAPDGFLDTAAKVAGVSAEGLTVSVAGLPVSALPPAGRAFASSFKAAVGTAPDTFTVYSAQATQVLLDAIARSDATRASVVTQLFRTRVRDGLMGSFAITPSGDTTASAVTIYRIRNGTQQVFRVITPPSRLLGP